MAVRKQPGLTEIMKGLSENLTRVSARPNLWGYKPHNKQVRFHTSGGKDRLYIGGNRSGKTVGGCVEDIWWLMGTHPYRVTPPPPVRGRIIGVDFDNGIEKILKPEITRWIPPSALIDGSWEKSYNKGLKTLTLANGSFLEFMSYVQEVEKFAGTSRHFVHFDEEPPKPIYTENKMRLVDTGGSAWISMTPVEGMTWVYDDLYLPGTSGESPLIDVIEVDMSENPYLSTVEIEDILSGLTALERKARKEGKFVEMGGLVFKRFGNHNVIDSIPMKQILTWRWIVSMDHGFNNPTCFLWHAISPRGQIVTFYEHYMAEWTIKQHAAEIHKINKMLGRGPELYVGDPSIRQRSAVTGDSIQVEYIQGGIPIALANNDVKAGIDRMNDYITGPSPQWVITANCPNLLKEMRRYRWKTHESAKLRAKNNPYDEPHKKDDHAVDAARYLMTFMPDLAPQEPSPQPNWGKIAVEQMINPGTPALVGDITDPRAMAGPVVQTEWTHIDEYMGGLY